MFRKRRKKSSRTTQSTLNAAAKRRKKSKKKYTLYYLLFLLTALIIGAVLCLTVFFKIETITLTGQTRYVDSEIIETANVVPGDNLIRVSSKKIKDSLTEKYVYIKDVSIQRQFPHILKINITMSNPVLQVESQGNTYLISDAARVLEINSPTAVQCPRIVGLDMSGITIGAYFKDTLLTAFNSLVSMDKLLQANGLTIDVIDMTDLSDVKFLYDGRLAIFLGGTNDLEYKIKFIKSAVMSNVDNAFVGTLDVSSRPSGTLKPVNIFLPSNWPFEPGLLEDYKRIIPSSAEKFQPEIKDEETPEPTS